MPSPITQIMWNSILAHWLFSKLAHFWVLMSNHHLLQTTLHLLITLWCFHYHNCTHFTFYTPTHWKGMVLIIYINVWLSVFECTKSWEKAGVYYFTVNYYIHLNLDHYTYFTDIILKKSKIQWVTMIVVEEVLRYNEAMLFKITNWVLISWRGCTSFWGYILLCITPLHINTESQLS